MKSPRLNLFLPTEADSKAIESKLSLPPWHAAFLLAPNVRFTRTPESELSRRRNTPLTTNKSNFQERNDIESKKQILKATTSLTKSESQSFLENGNSTELNIPLNPKNLSNIIPQSQNKTDIISSNTDESTHKTSTSSITVRKSSEQLSWLSDFAFFESIILQPPIMDTPTKSLPVPFQKHLEAPDSIISLFKTMECRQIGEPIFSRTSTESIETTKNTEIQKPCKKLEKASDKHNKEIKTIFPKSYPDEDTTYNHPLVNLLKKKHSNTIESMTAEQFEKKAGVLESILEDFGVKGEIINVSPGPVVTLYEFEPAPGTKSSRVIGLADDIARSMSSLSARVAVIPGRNVIGIELPNDLRETVYLRQIIDTQDFSKSEAHLALCLGKTIGGEAVIADLAKMPHLLVAGTTGSGKSVAINTMILSLLYRLQPKECRMIMVDPKMLELSIYDGIPHLLTPVVTDPKKAIMVLKWAVREMEERYRKMSQFSVRNIQGYNERILKIQKEGSTNETLSDLTTMPYIVVIVDEMADLMMVSGKEIEGAIQRLAQMARAAGIHLIMATQRPSVDVITGTIKANFPTRISFQVTSKIDSRTILGEHGAEQLLGQGDMLYMSGGGRIQRVHGPFVSDSEVEKVVQYIKSQGSPEYLDSITEEEDAENIITNEKTANSSEGTDESNEVYIKAVKLVIQEKKCSTSYIQRRLQIGYNRAALIVEKMEKEGLVGPANHVGKREILAIKFKDCI
ncbi:Cell division protein FtsK [Liberibacter crescens BT-1]|uniref:Cell division protein FtsK n=1 Tax=Liberibacter crescens (strain BT-1) TaxID=1215343 RepID=L0EWX8_LIBCB|nr:DNA translocase FtsK [Liberibacter crescens]AGA65158.1 Cell division protein FtsK [Liberibacter crescens BT-1]AMC13121.1 cell division protein [Liberibacter crescens]